VLVALKQKHSKSSREKYIVMTLLRNHTKLSGLKVLVDSKRFLPLFMNQSKLFFRSVPLLVFIVWRETKQQTRRTFDLFTQRMAGGFQRWAEDA